MAIRLLSPDMVGKIAAGEVVERPASIVKELVENSLDAGATAVQIELLAGGMELVRVADDGWGIPAEELRLAVERHATSKISTAEELDQISSLGFRGEALASIAAVSDLTISSRPQSQPGASLLEVIGGEVRPAATTSRAPGTTVTVRDLFFNVPARRKFLRTAPGEAAQIANLVGQFAMAYPEVAFELISDGRRVISAPGTGNGLDAAVAVLGPDLASALLPLDTRVESERAGRAAATIGGYAADSRVSRATRTGIWLFVNRRPIRSRSLSHAVEEGYATIMQVGRHPVAILLLEVPPTELDVNVHPTKAEVRLLRERLIYGAIRDSVRDAVGGGSRWGKELEGLSDNPLPSVPEVADFRQATLVDIPLAPQPVGAQDEETAGGHRLPILRLIGQVAQTYIVAEGEHGLYLIDQHAAHERVLLDRLTKAADRDGNTQLLLEATTLEMGAEEWELARESIPSLEALGYRLEPFGDRTLLIRGVPTEMPPGRAVPALEQSFRDLSEEKAGGQWKEQLAASLSCRGAVKAGQTLMPQEMRALVEALEETTITQHCSHGRPTAVLLSHRQLEREFGRR